MRKKEFEITDFSEIEEILDRAEVCRLGLADGGVPYIVPMNFGYRDRTLYFHTGHAGKKIDIIRKNSTVCFEVEIDAALIRSDTACGWGMAYRSVLGTGTARFIEDAAGRKEALDIIMAHYDDSKEWEYREASFRESMHNKGRDRDDYRTKNRGVTSPVYGGGGRPVPSVVEGRPEGALDILTTAGCPAPQSNSPRSRIKRTVAPFPETCRVPMTTSAPAPSLHRTSPVVPPDWRTVECEPVAHMGGAVHRVPGPGDGAVFRQDDRHVRGHACRHRRVRAPHARKEPDHGAGLCRAVAGIAEVVFIVREGAEGAAVPAQDRDAPGRIPAGPAPEPLHQHQDLVPAVAVRIHVYNGADSVVLHGQVVELPDCGERHGPVPTALPRRQRHALVPAVGAPLFAVEHDDAARHRAERALRYVDRLPPIREMAPHFSVQPGRAPAAATVMIINTRQNVTACFIFAP